MEISEVVAALASIEATSDTIRGRKIDFVGLEIDSTGGGFVVAHLFATGSKALTDKIEHGNDYHEARCEFASPEDLADLLNDRKKMEWYLSDEMEK